MLTILDDSASCRGDSCDEYPDFSSTEDRQRTQWETDSPLDLPDLSDDDSAAPSVEKIPAYLDGTLRDDVAELYSPPRMVPRCARFGLRGSLSMDLNTGYDLFCSEGKQRARWEVARRRPRFLMNCPPCTYYSKIQILWNKKKIPRSLWIQRENYADTLLKFAMDMCQGQIDTGDLYGFEHPRHATSWKKPMVQEISSKKPTYLANFDMCRFNLKTKVEKRPTKKATTLMTNMPRLHVALDGCLCQGREVHQPLHSSEGGMTRCRWASMYTDEFCDAVLAVLVANPR